MRWGLKVAFAIIGMVVGLSAGVSFGSVLDNFDAGVFGYVSGKPIFHNLNYRVFSI